MMAWLRRVLHMSDPSECKGPTAVQQQQQENDDEELEGALRQAHTLFNSGARYVQRKARAEVHTARDTQTAVHELVARLGRDDAGSS